MGLTTRHRCTPRTWAFRSTARSMSPRTRPTSFCYSRILDVLERGVTEGRRAFGNIMKFIMMAMSSNFGNMFSMAGATLILPFLPMLPVQILLNNLLYAVSEMPIPLDEVDSEITAKPEHWDMRFIRNFMLVMGPVRLDLRFSNLRPAASGFSCERSAVPDWLVRRVARHAGSGHLRATHAAQSTAQPPASPPHHHLLGRGRACGCATVHTAWSVVRLCSALCRLPLGDCGADCDLLSAGASREVGILPPVAAGWCAHAFDTIAPAAGGTIVTARQRIICRSVCPR